MSLLQSFYRFHSCWMPDKFHTLSHLPFCSRKCVPHFCTSDRFYILYRTDTCPCIVRICLDTDVSDSAAVTGAYIRHIFPAAVTIEKTLIIITIYPAGQTAVTDCIFHIESGTAFLQIYHNSIVGSFGYGYRFIQPDGMGSGIGCRTGYLRSKHAALRIMQVCQMGIYTNRIWDTGIFGKRNRNCFNQLIVCLFALKIFAEVEIPNNFPTSAPPSY